VSVELVRRALDSAGARLGALTRSWKGRLGLGASALALAGAVAGGSLLAPAAAGAQANVHIVQTGDSLTSLALRFYGNGALWPTIYNANLATIGPDPNLITIGSQLVIPNVATAAQAAPVVQVAQVQRTYTVVPGDVLNVIAFKVYGNHALWPAIYTANRALIGPNPNIIKEGMVLTIPANPQVTVAQQVVVRQVQAQPQVQVVYVAVPVPQAQPQVQAQSQGQPARQGIAGAVFFEPGNQIGLPVGSASQASGGTYTVRSGDTLVAISERVYGSGQYWRAIYEANQGTIGSNPANLPVGATLAIPQ
jgi:nucleoid-associated protein YgaU